MSQISPTSQPLYGGGMPSGAVSYASPTIPSQSTPHAGMSTTDKILISGGSLVAAVAVGTGIYYLAKKDKSSGKKTSATSSGTQRGNGTPSESASRGHETGKYRNNSNDPQDDDYEISPGMEDFVNAYKANDIRNSERLFKKLSPQEKKYFITEQVKNLNTAYELDLAKKMFSVFCDGNLSPEIDQVFISKARSIGIDPDKINFNKEILHLKSLSEKDKLSALNSWINELKHDDSSGVFIQQVKDILELYYEKCLKPEISKSTHEEISKLAKKELHMNFR